LFENLVWLNVWLNAWLPQPQQIEDSNTSTRHYVSKLNDFTKLATIECFENCAKLKSFDLNYSELQDEFLNNIRQYLSHSKIIRLETKCLSVRYGFKLIVRIENLQTFELFVAFLL
jgi:hypothetical protein